MLKLYFIYGLFYGPVVLMLLIIFGKLPGKLVKR